MGEHLLDVLAAEGIAAYLQPTADQNPILRATTLPARPTDRLFVDRTRLDTAREHLQKVTGGALPTPPAPPPAAPRPQAEVDAEWAKIIAGFHTTPDPTAPDGTAPDGTAAPWPSTENVDPLQEPPRPGRPVTEEGTPLNRRRTDPQEPSILYGLDTFGTNLPDEDYSDEDRYIPPPPPPMPSISKFAVMGVLGVVLGFVLFLFPGLIPIDPHLVSLLGFAAIVGGAVTLVWRLRSGDDDDEFDDGAVV